MLGGAVGCVSLSRYDEKESHTNIAWAIDTNIDIELSTGMSYVASAPVLHRC